MEGWLIAQYGTLGIVLAGILIWLASVHLNILGHKDDCAKRYEHQAASMAAVQTTLGQVNERMKSGDLKLDQLLQDVAVLKARDR